MISKNLTKYRNEKKYSKLKLAEETGLTARCIEYIEHNITQSPRISTLRKLAKALDIPVEKLID